MSTGGGPTRRVAVLHRPAYRLAAGRSSVAGLTLGRFRALCGRCLLAIRAAPNCALLQVRLATGELLEADVVVATADLPYVQEQLLI